MEAVQMALADTVGPSGMDHLVVPPQDGVRWFLNLNTPQEVEQARSLFSSASDIF
jgi:molybdopterin-guanine dinucleotide biosynthesis protein A